MGGGHIGDDTSEILVPRYIAEPDAASREIGKPRLGTVRSKPGRLAFCFQLGRVYAANADEDGHAMLWPRPGFDKEGVAIDDQEEFGLDRPRDRCTQVAALRRQRLLGQEQHQCSKHGSTHVWEYIPCHRVQQPENILALEVYGPTVYLPIAIARRIGTAATANLGRHVLRSCNPAAFLRLGESALRGRRKLLARFGGLMALVVMIDVGHRNIELEAA